MTIFLPHKSRLAAFADVVAAPLVLTSGGGMCGVTRSMLRTLLAKLGSVRGPNGRTQYSYRLSMLEAAVVGVFARLGVVVPGAKVLMLSALL